MVGSDAPAVPFRRLLASSICLLLAVAAPGQELPSLEQPWSWPVLYADPGAPLVQEIAVQGRFQAQYANDLGGDLDFGSRSAPEFSRWGDTEVRRWRVGPRIRFLRDFVLDGHVNVRPDLDPAYLSLYDLQVTWSRDPALSIVVGKTKVPYTQEYALSSARIPTIERSLLTNQVITTPLTGVAVFGQRDGWRYRAGVYANDPQPLEEFSRFDAGVAFVGKLQRDFGASVGVQQLWFGFDTFLHSEPPRNGQPAYTESVAMTLEAEQGRWNLYGDALWSGGEGIDNVGFTLLPTFRLTAELQLVFRQHMARSFGGDGISPPIRYDRFAPDVADLLTADGRGDRVHTTYLGVNWFVRGHQLKVMSGVEYTDLDGGRAGGGYDNWAFYLAVRTLF